MDEKVHFKLSHLVNSFFFVHLPLNLSYFMEHLKTPSSEKPSRVSSKTYIVLTAFLSLFAIVGIAYYGLPFFFDFMTNDFGWSHTTVTSGNALGKLLIGPLFGFIAGSLIDRFGPRLMMLVGSLLMGAALIGLGYTEGSLKLFYLFYIFNALGYVCAGPLPCQVLISRWFDENRGKAMGIAYLGIGLGGTFSPLLATRFESALGWNMSLAFLGILVIVISMPLVFFIKAPKRQAVAMEKVAEPPAVAIRSILTNRNFYLLGIGSMCAIGVVGGVGQHLKLYLREIEFTQEQAARIMSLVLMMSLIAEMIRYAGYSPFDRRRNGITGYFFLRE